MRTRSVRSNLSCLINDLTGEIVQALIDAAELILALLLALATLRPYVNGRRPDYTDNIGGAEPKRNGNRYADQIDEPMLLDISEHGAPLSLITSDE